MGISYGWDMNGEIVKAKREDGPQALDLIFIIMFTIKTYKPAGFGI